jgi:hypothetical protein
MPNLKTETAHNMGMLGFAYLASMPLDGELGWSTFLLSQRLHPRIGSTPIDGD